MKTGEFTPPQELIARAPGKLVLTGDYAVLLGAPSLVLAINRYASANLQVKIEGGWKLSSSLNAATSRATLKELADLPQNQLLKHLVRQLPNLDSLPEHAELHLITSDFYLKGEKLGIGSSASVLVALVCLFEQLTCKRWDDESLFQIHNAIHDSQGSGLDVAAARYGGLIRFEKQKTQSIKPNGEIKLRFLFTQSSASTSLMLKKFRQGVYTLENGSILDVWRSLATQVADSYEDTPKFMSKLHDLNQFVYEFDQLTQIGIYSDPHLQAMKLAQQYSVLYKPSGAGGGDMGIAISDDIEALNQFQSAAVKHDLIPIDLEVDSNGTKTNF